MSAEGEGPVVFDPADFGAVPAAKELRRWMRKVRRGKADRTFWQQFESIYVVFFTVVMVAACGGNVLRQLNQRSAQCLGDSCYWLMALAPFILVPLLVSAMLRVLLSVGPVAASRATGFWLLASPVDRAALLRPSYRLVMVSAALVGAAAAGVSWAIFGAGWSAVGEAVVLTTVLLICTACVAVWAQQSGRRTRWGFRVADALLVVAAVPALVLATRPAEEGSTKGTVVISTYVLPAEEPLLTPEVVRLLLVGGFALLMAVVLVMFTAQSLDKLSRQSVVAGGDLLAGIAGAAVALDVGLLADVVASRHWRLVARVKSRRGRASYLEGVVYREALRIVRWPRRLVVGFALLLVPYAVAGTGYDVLVPLVAGLAGFLATRPLMDGLRSVCRSPGLVRALGLELRPLRLAMSVVPGIFAIVWTACALPALGDPAFGVAVAGGVLAGVVRQASAGPPSYTGPLLASPMGAIPPGLFSQPIRGFDLLLVCLAPVLLGFPTLAVALIPPTVCVILFAVKPKQS